MTHVWIKCLWENTFGWREFKFDQMNGHAPFQMDIIVKLIWQTLKTVSRPTGPLSTKLGTKLHWVKGIQVCSKERPCPLLSLYNSGAANIQNTLTSLRNLPRTTWLIPTKLGTNHLWGWGWDSGLSKWRTTPFSKERIISKIHLQPLKTFSKTTESISTKLGTNKASLCVRTQGFANIRPFNSQTRDNDFFF